MGDRGATRPPAARRRRARGGHALGGREIWRPLADRPRLPRPLRESPPGPHRRPVQAHRPDRRRAGPDHGVGGGRRRLARGSGRQRCGRGDDPRARQPLDGSARGRSCTERSARPRGLRARPDSLGVLAALHGAVNADESLFPGELVSTTRPTTIAVAYSPDGPTLATGGRRSTVRLWDATTGEMITTLTGHTGWVSAASPSPRRPDPRHRQRRQHRPNLGPHHRPTHSTPSPATPTGSAVAFPPTANPRHRQRRQHRHHGTPPPANTLTPSPATPTGSGRGLLPRRPHPRHRQRRHHRPHLGPHHRPTTATLTGHTGWVTAACLHPRRHTLATASDDTTAIIWDPTTGQPRTPSPATPAGVTTVAYAPDGQTLATASDDTTASIWDPTTGQPRTPSPATPTGSTAVAFSPDGQPSPPPATTPPPTSGTPPPAHCAPPSASPLGVRVRPSPYRGDRRRRDRRGQGHDPRRRPGGAGAGAGRRGGRHHGPRLHGHGRLPRVRRRPRRRSAPARRTRAASHAAVRRQHRHRGRGHQRGRAAGGGRATSSADVEIIELGDDDTHWQISDIDNAVDVAFEPDGEVLAVARGRQPSAC